MQYTTVPGWTRRTTVLETKARPFPLQSRLVLVLVLVLVQLFVGRIVITYGLH